MGLIPLSGRSPGAGCGNPLQYSCLENRTDRGTWRGRKESDTTEMAYLARMHVLSERSSLQFFLHKRHLAKGNVTSSNTLSAEPLKDAFEEVIST